MATPLPLEPQATAAVRRPRRLRQRIVAISVGMFAAAALALWLTGANEVAAVGPNIKVGDEAPDFSATTSAGVSLQLSSFRGEKSVVLFFYPKDETAVCTREACSFRDSFEKFAEAGAVVIGVSGDSDDSHRKFAARHDLPFHLVSDGDGRLRRLYGAKAGLGLLPGRVTFVIDQEGIVRQAFSAMFASDEHVRQALAALPTP